MIQLEGISKQFNGTLALSNVDLKIPQGQVIGLLGPNGSGKSTLIKILCSVIPLFQGEVKYAIEKKEIALASEEIWLPSHYSVDKALEIFKEIHGSTAQDIAIVMDQLGLNEHRRKSVRKLSQGLKQRLNIACALMNKNSKLLIFDEPNNGLDHSGFKLVRDLILKLKSEGKTILIASHILSELEPICDRFAFLKRGILVSQASKTELLETFGSLEAAYEEYIEKSNTTTLI